MECWHERSLDSLLNWIHPFAGDLIFPIQVNMIAGGHGYS